MGILQDAFRSKVGYWLESGGLRKGISGDPAEFSKIFAEIRVKNEESGCSIILDFRKKGFYSSLHSEKEGAIIGKLKQLDARNNKNIMNDNKNIAGKFSSPFFILGSGRSGSTLLRMILSEHSKVTIPPETWYILPLVETLPISSVLNHEQIQQAIDIITTHYRWPDLHLDTTEFIQNVLSLKDATLRQIIEIVYNDKMAEEGKTIWGDKTPPYIKIIPELSKMFPEARYIYLIRDGRDVARSFQSKGWYGQWLHNNTQEWKGASLLHEKYKKYQNIETKYWMLNMKTLCKICKKQSW